MSTVEQNNAPPVSAAPSQGQPVRKDEPTSRSGTAQQPADATEKTEEEKRQESWKILMTAVEKYDEGMVKNWKEDIDTLLVFGGLFSAVVTAFLIESYQWLSEDPADTTVMLLTQISMQLNTSQPVSMFPQRPEFQPDASSIRINCWWFLSLVFSLTSALFGLLCKQWLREQQRDPPTRTPAEALALRQMRRDSFEKWGVSSFLSVLPILLEVALLFFFVGILDLLWARHPIPFAFCLVSVVLSAGLYFVTTFLPVLALFLRWKSTIHHLYRPSYHFVCPYKSPQAWAVYQLLFKALHTLYKIPSIKSHIDKLPKTLKTHIENPASDWSSFDLRVIRKSSTWLLDSLNFNIYELRAFQWAFTTFQDSPSMLPHLQNVLGTIPPSVAMSAVLRRWRPTMWRDIQKSDVDLWFSNQQEFQRSLDWYIMLAPEPNLRYPTLLHSEGIKLLWFHQYWQALAIHGWTRALIASIESHQADLQNLVNLQFVIPFTVIEKLWTHGDRRVQEWSLRLLKDAFSIHSEYDKERHDWECLTFIYALINHLDRTDFTSYVATSIRGQDFIRFVHEHIISRRLYRSFWDPEGHQTVMSVWARATRRVAEIGRLPADYFLPIPGIPAIEPLNAGVPLPITDPDYLPRAEDENGGAPQSDHEMNDDGQGSGAPGSTERSEGGNEAGDVGAEEVADGIPHPNINPGHPPQAANRHSEYEMTNFGQDVPGSAERGEHDADKVGGTGAEERV